MERETVGQWTQGWRPRGLGLALDKIRAALADVTCGAISARLQLMESWGLHSLSSALAWVKDHPSILSIASLGRRPNHSEFKELRKAHNFKDHFWAGRARALDRISRMDPFYSLNCLYLGPDRIWKHIHCEIWVIPALILTLPVNKKKCQRAISAPVVWSLLSWYLILFHSVK